MPENMIFAPSETTDKQANGFWNEATGTWGNSDVATRYTDQQKETMALPASKGMDARWVKVAVTATRNG